jgi:hypothetical protein
MEHNNEFDDMMAGWKRQPIPKPTVDAGSVAVLAKRRVGSSRRKHVATIVVLGITLVVLVAFALLTKGNSSQIAKGIQLMIGALLIRIGVEWLSIMLLNKLDITKGTAQYLKMLTSFYTTRRKIHGAFTYIIFGFYVAGFCMMLPLFKQTLPYGFFIYIAISGVVIFTVLLVYIRKKTVAELKELQATIYDLKGVSQELNG